MWRNSVRSSSLNREPMSKLQGQWGTWRKNATLGAADSVHTDREHAYVRVPAD